MSSPATDIAATEIRLLPRIPSWSWWLLALLPAAVNLFIGLHHLKLSWDDAAITAAFSRTWAETGRIALTPVSQVVEGYSSVLWFLLLSIPYFFTHNPDAGLIWMKILSAAFFLLSLTAIYHIAWRQFRNRSAAIGSVLLLAYCITPNLELQNGMEMNLVSFLLLLLFHVLTNGGQRHRVLYASIIGSLLLLARFESPFMLGLLFCGFLYAAHRNRPDAVPIRDLLTILAVTVLCFVLIEVWRHHLFGEWMPNTVYAKRFTPYSDWSTPAKFLATRLRAMCEPILVLLVPIGVALFVCIGELDRKRPLSPSFGRIHPAIRTLALGCFLFGAMIGHSWGHNGRMVAAMLPFLILAAVGVCVNLIPDKRLFAHMVGILIVGHSLIWLLASASFHIDYGSLKTIEPLGTNADSIRAALHRDRIVVMLPDVGASSLCCERLNIVDVGLLTDSTLAHTGWKGFAPYFRKVRPDVVEIYSSWATQTQIYDTGLLDDYSVVASRGTRFFVRNDLFNELVDLHAGSMVPVKSVPAVIAFPWNSTEDVRFSLSKQNCLVLNTTAKD